LTKETLDFRIVPTWVNPVNKKADGSAISGTVVPVLVAGTFSSPKFKPDLASAAKKSAGKVLTDILGGSSKKSEDGASEKPDAVEDTVKGLLKKLPFGK
jgi:AsmA protein